MLKQVLLLSLVPAAVLSAQDSTRAVAPRPVFVPSAIISASASSDVKVVPDRATVRLGVQTRGSSAAAAASENATRQSAVIARLHALGLSNEQVYTVGYSVSPEFRYPQNEAPIITGYTVSNTVVAELRDMKQIGPVLDAALAAGANEISSLDFSASNVEAQRQQAIGAAVQKARAEAESAARAAGGSLGPLVSISIGGNAPEPVRPMMRAMALASQAAPTPINPGEQTVSVTVATSWRFVPQR